MFNKSVWTLILYFFKNVESYILILSPAKIMKTGNESVKKNENKSQVLCFFLATTSGNLCEVSLPPLPIFFACGIHFYSLISFLFFNFCVCSGALIS